MSLGPSLAIIAKHTLASGRFNGLAVAWSHACGVGIYALATLIGLAVVLAKALLVFKTITIAGAVYLAYLGVKALLPKGGVAEKLAAGDGYILKQIKNSANLLLSVKVLKLTFFI